MITTLVIAILYIIVINTCISGNKWYFVGIMM